MGVGGEVRDACEYKGSLIANSIRSIALCVRLADEQFSTCVLVIQLHSLSIYYKVICVYTYI